jgi:hypothetical protein
MPLRTTKYVQIQVAVTVAMIIFLHFVQSLQEILWIPLAHCVTAKNLKNGVSIYLVQYNKNSSFGEIIKPINYIVDFLTR